eukprot:403344336
MRLIYFITLICIIGYSQQSIITAYQGSCTKCIGNGYNYCADNSTCVDNRPSFCFTLYDKPMKCPSQTCVPITISDNDVYSQKEAQYNIAPDFQCVLPLIHTLTKTDQSSYFFVLIDQSTTMRFNLTTAISPTYYSEISPYYQGWRQDLNNSYTTKYLLVQNYGSAIQSFRVIYSQAINTVIMGFIGLAIVFVNAYI